MRRRLSNWARNAGLAALSLLLALASTELAVRVVAPQQLVSLRPDLWMAHDGLGWRHRPGVDILVNTGERTARFKTDEHGHRVGPRPAARSGYRVLALGDSLIEALQVDHGETLTARLERQVSRRLGGSLRVANAGVGGWDTNQYLIAAREELARASYDAVLVFLYLGNDLVSRRFAHLPPHPATPTARLRLPADLTRSEWTAAVAYPINQYLEARSHLFVLTRHRLRFLLARLRLAAVHVPTVMLRREAASPRWELTTAICRDLAAVAGPATPTVFVLLPTAYQVDRRLSRRYLEALGLDPESVDLDQPARQMLARFESAGLRAVDATPALREAHRAGGAELYGRVDAHLAPRGHLVVARMLEPIVSGLLAPDGEDRTEASGAP